jgi:hypothetical protein
MIRIIGSAIIGYIVIFVLVIVLMTASWFAVGIDGVFLPGVWDVTPTWLVLLLAAAIVAAVVGGYVSAMITPDRRGPLALVVIVVVLGIFFALPVLLDPGAPLPSRPDGLPMLEAMQNGRQPAWVALLNPVLGAIGVMIGAKLRQRPAT